MDLLVKFVGVDGGPRTRPESGGHYDALRISRHASAEAVRKAYRARALVTHPDKGGSQNEFQRVMDAFMVLSNDELRQEYDVDLYERNDNDGMDGMTISTCNSRLRSSHCQSPRPNQRPSTEANANPAIPLSTREVAARKAVEVLLDALWDGLQDLEGLSPLTLCELNRLLHDQGEHIEASKESIPHSQRRFQTIAHITKLGNKYFVRMGLDKLVITTRSALCLETVIDWQIELVRLINEAKARAAKAPFGFANPPVLTREEITKAILRMPQMQLSFSCCIYFARIHGQEVRLRTPQIQNLPVALQLMDKLLAANIKFKKEEPHALQKMIQTLKAQMIQATTQSKQLYARRVQSLRSALVPIIPRVVEENEVRIQELESAFNEAQAGLGVAQALQSAFNWSKESAVYAIGHIKRLPPQELQRRLKHLLAPPRAGMDHCELDRTRGRSRSRPSENDQVTPYHFQPDRSRSRPRRSSSVQGRQFGTNHPAGRNRRSADGNRSRHNHSATSQAPPSRLQHVKTETALMLYDPCSQTPQPLRRPDIPPPFRRGNRTPHTAMSLPFDTASRMVRWLTLRDLEVFQSAGMCTKDLRDREVWLRLRKYVFSESVPISRQSSRGRALRRTASSETSIQAQYLSSFCDYYAQAFVELDLHAVRAQVLEDPTVMSTISRLPYLAYLALPKAGWSCTIARKHFLNVLHDSVAYEFCSCAL